MRAIHSSTSSSAVTSPRRTRWARPSPSYWSYSAKAILHLYLLVLIDPRRRALEVGCEFQQTEFVAEAADELYADGQAFLVPVQRHVDRRLPGDVLHRCER